MKPGKCTLERLPVNAYTLRIRCRCKALEGLSQQFVYQMILQPSSAYNWHSTPYSTKIASQYASPLLQKILRIWLCIPNTQLILNHNQSKKRQLPQGSLPAFLLIDGSHYRLWQLNLFYAIKIPLACFPLSILKIDCVSKFLQKKDILLVFENIYEVSKIYY